MTKLLKVFFIIGILLSSFSSFCMADGLPPAPTKDIYVSDNANILNQETKTSLLNKLNDFDKNGGGQIVVLTTTDYGETGSIEEFSNEVFNKWGIGHSGKDNGILVVVNSKAHRARIEVGRGYEGDLPDIAAKHIIDEKGIPYFKKDDYNNGVVAMVDGVMGKLGSGDTISAPSSNDTVTSTDATGTVDNEQTTKTIAFLILVASILLGIIAILNIKGEGGGSSGFHSSSGSSGGSSSSSSSFGGGGSSSSSSSFGGGGSDGGGSSGSW